MTASVIAWSGKIFPHSPNGWLAVTSKDRPLVSGADEFEQDAGFGLILGDVGEVVEDEQMIFVELGDGTFEGELAARELKFLHEFRGSGEECSIQTHHIFSLPRTA